MAPLPFAGGDHAPAIKTPETLLKSAAQWLELAGQDYLEGADALQRGDKGEAVARLKAGESKSAQARQDIVEAMIAEAGAS